MSEDQVQVTPPTEQPPPPQGPELTTGFVIGIAKDGRLVFELLGTEVNMAALLGLVSVAKERVDTLVSVQMKSGLVPVVEELNALKQQINVILNLLTEEQKRKLLGR